MLPTAPVPAEISVVLGELTRLGMDLAREVQARARQAEGVKEIADIALAFERVARCVRMTIALEGRLAEQARAAERYERRQGLYDRMDGQRFADAIAKARKAQLRRRLQADLPQAADAKGAKALQQSLAERVERESLIDGFIDAPIDDCIARIRADLGLVSQAMEAAPDLEDPETYRLPAHTLARLSPDLAEACEAIAQRLARPDSS